MSGQTHLTGHSLGVSAERRTGGGPPHSPDPVLSPNPASGSLRDLINTSSGLPTFCTLSLPSLSCPLSSGAPPVLLTGSKDRMAAWWRNRQCSAGPGCPHGNPPTALRPFKARPGAQPRGRRSWSCAQTSNNSGLKRPSYPSDQSC